MSRPVAATVLLLVAGAWTARWAWEAGRGPAPGDEVILSLVDVVGHDGPETVRVEKGGRVHVLVGVPGSVSAGDAISVGGIVRPDGSVQVTWVEAHPGRAGKRWLGVAGLLGALGVGVLGLERRPEGWGLRG